MRINQSGADNSFATDHPKNEIRFGKGGVDDAEDAEVILHEYGHAIHFAQNFSFASEEAGAISEGFGDYWAVTVSDVVAQSLGVPELEPLPCVADWDSTSYTSTVPHCLRRVDTDLHYPADLNGEVHHDGQIWSRALWDIRQALGNVKADTIILQGSFDFPGTTMTDLANRTVAAAQQLYGKSARHSRDARPSPTAASSRRPWDGGPRAFEPAPPGPLLHGRRAVRGSPTPRWGQGARCWFLPPGSATWSCCGRTPPTGPSSRRWRRCARWCSTTGPAAGCPNPGRGRRDWTPTWRCSRPSPTSSTWTPSTCSASPWAPRCRSPSRRGSRSGSTG